MVSWRDNLVRLKEELADVRARRQQRVEEEDAELDREREALTRQSQDLGIIELLTEMNATLLDGRGEVENIVGWETGGIESEPLEPSIVNPSIVNLDADDDLEQGDVITTVLSWEEGGDLEMVVDLGISDDGTYLQVNGIEIRPERGALEQALVEAFRDELDL